MRKERVESCQAIKAGMCAVVSPESVSAPRRDQLEETKADTETSPRRVLLAAGCSASPDLARDYTDHVIPQA